MNMDPIFNHIYPARIPKFDPFNLPRSTVSDDRFGYDEIHPDATQIIERLKYAVNENDVQGIVWEAFRDLFMDGIAGKTLDVLFNADDGHRLGIHFRVR